MIVIIDYGMGNLSSVQNGFAEAGFATLVSSDPAEIAAADGLVLPGVGAFGQAMENLRRDGLDQVVLERTAKGVPLLGICLGLHLLFDRSSEMGNYSGLGLIPGDIILFDGPQKVPQIGWNQLDIKRSHPLLDGIKNGDYFYFVHSYYARPDSEAVKIGRAHV